MTIEEKEQLYCSQGDTSGRHSPKKYFVRGEGSFLFDKSGNSYLDMQMCHSSANFGYQNPQFENAVISQLKTMPTLSGEFLCESRVLLAERICSYMESKYGVKGRVHFSIGGAQAVDDALKIIASYTGNKNVFTFEGGYHGRTMATSSISSSYRYHKQFGNVINTYKIPFPCCSRCPYEKEPNKCELYCIRQFERLFESEYYGVFQPSVNESMYSAFIAEPLQGRSGYTTPPNRYFEGLSNILHQHNIILMFDEIQMGFFRTGKLWAFENYNVVPDVFTFGKAISNGIWPLSGVWAREDIISPEQWPIGSSHATFSGNPLAMELGLTAFDIIEQPSFALELRDREKKFSAIIAQLKRDYRIIGRADCCGMAAGLEIVDQSSGLPDSKRAHKIAEIALRDLVHINGKKYGLILSLGGIFENAFLLSPSLLITKEELELFEAMIRHYLDA